MIEVKLTEDEILALLKYVGPVVERWRGEATLRNAHAKLDLALFKYEENGVRQHHAKQFEFPVRMES